MLVKKTIITQPGEYVIGTQGHFIALRWLDDELSINFGKRRHEWEPAFFDEELEASNSMIVSCSQESQCDDQAFCESCPISGKIYVNPSSADAVFRLEAVLTIVFVVTLKLFLWKELAAVETVDNHAKDMPGSGLESLVCEMLLRHLLDVPQSTPRQQAVSTL